MTSRVWVFLIRDFPLLLYASTPHPPHPLSNLPPARAHTPCTALSPAAYPSPQTLLAGCMDIHSAQLPPLRYSNTLHGSCCDIPNHTLTGPLCASTPYNGACRQGARPLGTARASRRPLRPTPRHTSLHRAMVAGLLGRGRHGQQPLDAPFWFEGQLLQRDLLADDRVVGRDDAPVLVRVWRGRRRRRRRCRILLGGVGAVG